MKREKYNSPLHRHANHLDDDYTCFELPYTIKHLSLKESVKNLGFQYMLCFFYITETSLRKKRIHPMLRFPLYLKFKSQVSNPPKVVFDSWDV